MFIVNAVNLRNPMRIAAPDNFITSFFSFPENFTVITLIAENLIQK